LLDQAKIDLEEKFQKRIEESVRKFKAILSIDGWSSVIGWPLINGKLVSSVVEQFIGSIDAKWELKRMQCNWPLFWKNSSKR